MWSPEGPTRIQLPRPGWSGEGPPRTPQQPKLGWWVLYSIAGAREITFASETEIKALKLIGAGVEVLADLNAALEITAGAGFPIVTSLDTSADIFKTAMIGTGVEVDLQSALEMIRIAEYNLGPINNEVSTSVLLGKLSDLEADFEAHLTAGIEVQKTAPMQFPLVTSLQGSTVITRVAAIDVAQHIATYTSAEVSFPPMSPQSVTFNYIGSTELWYFPRNAQFIDLVALGGGASGQTGHGGILQSGNGGRAGGWSTYTHTRGSSRLPWNQDTIGVRVGHGGERAPNSDHAGPNSGGTTEAGRYVFGGIEYAAWGEGGSGTNTSQNGQSVNSIPYNGQIYDGGAGATGSGNTGGTPGGGGSGGNGGIFGSRTRGGAGGPGRAWGRAYQ